MKTVPLVTFNELEPAQQLRDRLQQAGIPATIHDESRLERFGFMSKPLAAIHVEVPQAHYLAARHFVEGMDASEGLVQRAVRCPECHSSRVEYPQLTRKFVTPALVGLFMALRIVPREFYCLDCQFTWPAVAPVPREFDLLNFPTDAHIWPGEKKHPVAHL
jgi:hypothetical protein